MLNSLNATSTKNYFRQHFIWCLFFLAILGIALWVHRNNLGSGFWRDDFEFIEAFRHTTVWEACLLWKPGAFWCYRPVFLLYWWLGLQIWGENAFLFHLASVFLHAIAVFLFALLIARLTRQQWMGMAAATLFLLHPAISAANTPLNERSIDAITWISSVSTLLAAAFSFATLHAWISWRQTEKKQYGFWALLFCWLALCSKEDAFALPFIIFAFDFIFWPKATRWRLLPVVLIMTGYAGLNYLTNYIAVSAQPGSRNYLHFALTDRLITTGHYAAVAWNGTLPMLLWAGSGLFLLLGWFVRRNKVALAVWIWILVAVLPAPMGVGPHALGTRFYYVPVFAVSAFSVIGISYLVSGGHRVGIERTLTRIVGVFWLVALIGSYLLLPLPDFAIQSCAILVLLATTIMLIREKYVPLFWGTWSVILLLGYYLPFWGLDLPPGVLPFIIATLLTVVFGQRWKVAILPAFAVAYFASIDPVWYPLLTTFIGHSAFILEQTGRFKLSNRLQVNCPTGLSLPEATKQTG